MDQGKIGKSAMRCDANECGKVYFNKIKRKIESDGRIYQIFTITKIERPYWYTLCRECSTFSMVVEMRLDKIQLTKMYENGVQFYWLHKMF